ncbi:MAG: DUF4097 domain-containing protein [Bacteroidales bacterium]|nr:DUF4097 domain-containing protein [Bacteroidales bacterium]
MKNLIFTCVLAILMSFSNTLFSQKIVEKSSPIKENEELTLNFEFADQITVTTWNKNEVYVKVIVSINNNEDNDKFKLELNQRSTGIVFKSEIENMKSLQTRKRIVDEDGHTITYNSVEMDLFFEVKVPANIDLEIETISGDIDIKGVLGRMDINTISGFIDISLPEKHNADLELSTISGGMYSDFEFNNRKYEGYHHYGKRDLSKRLNNGGTRIFLETISGDIYLRKDK